MAMSGREIERRSLAAKRSPALRQSKAGIPHGNPELTRRILESMPREIDAIKAGRVS
jgi:hypothetical protein